MYEDDDDSVISRFLLTCRGIFISNYRDVFNMSVEDVPSSQLPICAISMWSRLAEKIKNTFVWTIDEVDENLDIVSDVLVSFERDNEVRPIQEVRHMVAEQGVEFTLEETAFYLSMLIAIYSSALLRKRKKGDENA